MLVQRFELQGRRFTNYDDYDDDEEEEAEGEEVHMALETVLDIQH